MSSVAARHRYNSQIITYARTDAEMRRLGLSIQDLAERSMTTDALARMGGLPERSPKAAARRAGRRLRPTEWLLYGLVRRASQKGFPAIRATALRLARLLHCSERSVRRAWDSLTELGVIKTIARYKHGLWTDSQGRTWNTRRAETLLLPGPQFCRPKRTSRLGALIGKTTSAIFQNDRTICPPFYSPPKGREGVPSGAHPTHATTNIQSEASPEGGARPNRPRGAHEGRPPGPLPSRQAAAPSRDVASTSGADKGAGSASSPDGHEYASPAPYGPQTPSGGVGSTRGARALTGLADAIADAWRAFAERGDR